MTDQAAGRPSAGAMLRAAREKQGLHIAALAAAIKVSPRKLDALENDRYDDLPGAAFTRALAQTVCRSLKIDAAAVLALLPHADPAALDHVAGTLNQPFRDRPGRADPSRIAAAAVRPMVWAALALIVAALAIHFLPESVWSSLPAAPQPAAAASAANAASAAALPASAAASAEAAVSPAPAASPAQAAAPVAASAATAAASADAPVAAQAPLASAPAVSAAPVIAVAASSAGGPAPQGLVRLQASGDSWVQAIGPRGQLLYSHLLQAGESAAFDGDTPIKVTVGNASVTSLEFRGQPVDLGAVSHGKVARLELK